MGEVRANQDEASGQAVTTWAAGAEGLHRHIITSQRGAATLRSSHIFSKSCRGEAR